MRSGSSAALIACRFVTCAAAILAWWSSFSGRGSITPGCICLCIISIDSSMDFADARRASENLVHTGIWIR